MSQKEVAIIIIAIIVVGYLWMRAHAATQTANPTNAASPGLQRSGCGAIL